MDVKKLSKDQLLLLAAELGLEVNQSMRKPEIRRAIEEVDFEEDDITDAWEKICRVEKERADEREKQKEIKEKKQTELEEARSRELQELMRRLHVLRWEKTRARLRVFRRGESFRSFLKTFEGICTEEKLDQGDWSMMLSAVLPCGVAAVLARLSDESAQNYEEAKSALFRYFGIRAEAESKRQVDSKQPQQCVSDGPRSPARPAHDVTAAQQSMDRTALVRERKATSASRTEDFGRKPSETCDSVSHNGKMDGLGANARRKEMCRRAISSPQGNVAWEVEVDVRGQRAREDSHRSLIVEKQEENAFIGKRGDINESKDERERLYDNATSPNELCFVTQKDCSEGWCQRSEGTGAAPPSVRLANHSSQGCEVLLCAKESDQEESLDGNALMPGQGAGLAEKYSSVEAVAVSHKEGAASPECRTLRSGSFSSAESKMQTSSSQTAACNEPSTALSGNLTFGEKGGSALDQNEEVLNDDKNTAGSEKIARANVLPDVPLPGSEDEAQADRPGEENLARSQLQRTCKSASDAEARAASIKGTARTAEARDKPTMAVFKRRHRVERAIGGGFAKRRKARLKKPVRAKAGHPGILPKRSPWHSRCDKRSTKANPEGFVKAKSMWVQKLYCYIQGTKFPVDTDYCPLSWLRQMSGKNGRLLRWSLILQEYNFDVKYKKGSENLNADGLSRGF